MNAGGAEHTRAVDRLAELVRRVYASAGTEDVLEGIVQGVVEVLGFGVAAIARLEGDELVITQVQGPEDARRQLLGRRTPAKVILDEFHNADTWGILRFIPHDRVVPLRSPDAWIPDLDYDGDDPDAWHPQNRLYAPLYSPAGELLGNMAVDMPPNNKIPMDADRHLLEMFVVQAGIALFQAQQRDRLRERVRLGEMEKNVALASSSGEMHSMLESAAQAIHVGLSASQIWLRVFPDTQFSADGDAVAYPHDLFGPGMIPFLRRDLVSVSMGDLATVRLTDEEFSELPASGEHLQTALKKTNSSFAIVTPIKIGYELHGYLIVAFDDEHRSLTEVEADAIHDVARELGTAVHTARMLETEKRLVTEMRELDRYRSELIATISHELKTPLTAIMGHAELLGDMHSDIGSIDAIMRNAQRLNRLIGNLLNYSRVQGRREIVRRACDVVELCESSLDLLSVRAANVGITIDFQRPDHPVVIFGDTEELGRVIDNLLDNAVKYSPNGGDVKVEIEEDDDNVRVRVTDSGIGISEGDQAHLFSPFHRSSNPTAQSIPGTGLGLAISRSVVTAHGGSIDVVSALGKGSTFTLTLPTRAPARS